MGEPLEDYATPVYQVARRERLDSLVAAWIAERPLAECLRVMRQLEVVASGIYSAKDILADETYRERDNVVTVQDRDLGPVRMQNVVPKLANYAGAVWRTAPELGEDNVLVYGEFLGQSPADLDRLSAAGTI